MINKSTVAAATPSPRTSSSCVGKVITRPYARSTSLDDFRQSAHRRFPLATFATTDGLGVTKTCENGVLAWKTRPRGCKRRAP